MTDPTSSTPPTPENPGNAGAPSSDDCTMAMLSHLLGGILGFLVPLIIWLVKKDQSAFVNQESKEALNFQLTFLIVVIPVSVVTCGIGFFPLWIVSLIFGIIGGLKAKEGQAYRYPVALRLIK